MYLVNINHAGDNEYRTVLDNVNAHEFVYEMNDRQRAIELVRTGHVRSYVHNGRAMFRVEEFAIGGRNFFRLYEIDGESIADVTEIRVVNGLSSEFWAWHHPCYKELGVAHSGNTFSADDYDN
jgi:hypothetical protein